MSYSIYVDEAAAVTPLDWHIILNIYNRDRYDIEDHGNVLGGDAQGVTTEDNGQEPIGYVETEGGRVAIYPLDDDDIQKDDVTPGLPIDQDY
jgi:hypothetical protein